MKDQKDQPLSNVFHAYKGQDLGYSVLRLTVVNYKRL